MRASGILFPISALPNEYGIGTLGTNAFVFVDFLKSSGQKYWQVLPLGPTSYGDSPYQTYSSIAGNPYLIDLELLKNDNLLTLDDLKDSKKSGNIDYEWLYNTRFDILRKAYHNFKDYLSLNEFIKKTPWLLDYALFMSIKTLNGGKPFYEWDKPLKYREDTAINEFKENNADEINFWCFIQYIFFKQYNNLKNYASSQGIKIIGDIPIYVALDSVDVWCNKEEFELDPDLLPTRVAGCPPDSFSALGQRWGNPLYNYDTARSNNFKWWIQRIKYSKDLYDVIRIDHFRGFEAYYTIEAKYNTAEIGSWEKGPGMELFNAIKASLGDTEFIAENLGFLTPEVEQLLNDTGYPGMKILQFGFDSLEPNDYTPHLVTPNNVYYTGTHDNPPLMGWFELINEETLKHNMEYFTASSKDDLCDKMIRCALASNTILTIIPLQDYLHQGNESRINTPSQLGGNWVYKLDNMPSSDLARYINKLVKTYYR